MRISVSSNDRYWVSQIASTFIDELGSSAPDPQNGLEWQASGYNEAIDP